MMFLRKTLSKLHRVSLRAKILVALVVIMALFLYRVSFSTKYFIVEKYGEDQIKIILQGAHNYFYDKLENMTYLFRTVTAEIERHEINVQELAELQDLMNEWPKEYRPEIFFITDLQGRVLYSKNRKEPLEEIYNLKILSRALNTGEVSGIELLDPSLLELEGILKNNCIKVIATTNATHIGYDEECRAMAMMVAKPVRQGNEIVGIAVVGKILNKSTLLVDNIKENFDVRSTIFLEKVRISTNILDDYGGRAIGTLLSDPVYEQVILKGERFTGRAFVVNDWYITAYEPIHDVDGKVIGALYVGANERPLLAVQQSVNNQIRGTLLVAVIVFVVAIMWIYRSIIKPIQGISAGALHIAKGDFNTRFSVEHPNECWKIIGCEDKECEAYENLVVRCWLLRDAKCRVDSGPDFCLSCDVYKIYNGNELDSLTDAVNYMVNCIDVRTKALEELNQELEDKNKELLDHKDELENQKDELLRLNAQLQDSMRALDDSQNIIYALAVAVEAKDPYTRGHSERVAEYSVRLAKRLGIEGHELDLLKGAALLHDIGKIGISGSILRKPGSLNAIEFQQVRKHPSIGERICLSLKFAREMLPIIRHHHEHFNGQGYPDGLRGEHIPLLARIIAIADAYDAMTSDRPYRSGLPPEEAERRLEEGAGTQWDPRLVPIFISMLRTEGYDSLIELKEGEQFVD